MPIHPPSSTLHPRRILVRGVNWLGDAVMTTPALQRLREKFPRAHITLLTPEKLKDLWLHHPSIDDTISFSPDANIWSLSSRLKVWQFSRSFVQDYERLQREWETPGGSFLSAMAAGTTAVFLQIIGRVTGMLPTGGTAGGYPFDLALVLPNSPRS